MLRATLAAIATAGAALAVAAPANAITYGVPDGGAHPEVGALLAQEAYSDGTWTTCSGTLISPTVFLTAAHCDEGVDRVKVTFDSTYVAPGTTYAGTYHADPAYDQAQSDPHDIAVVVLDKAVKGIRPARLPAAGSLSGLSGDQTFTSVGYGAQSVTQGGGPKELHYADVRYQGAGTLNSVTPSWLRISMNPATGNAGTCYGDSGGPNFLGSGATETDIVAGTTITGDMWCRSTNVDYRLDTASARAFLGQYVTLP
jgi:secreted trypsin-like serine protease